jgi:alpha-glucosidase
VSFSGMDIGGFTGGASSALYTRWMQIGAFIPYFRNHTGLNTKSSEPWTYGEDALNVSRNYINLRYKLLPYLYSTFYESTQNGIPVLRSLAINYTFDPKVFEAAYQNQYMFGQALMVAPFESTKEFGKIYFPEGNWYNLYNDEKYKGKQEIIQPVTICQLPVFVKEGSIIPMQSLVQSTADAPTDTLVLHVYNGERPNEFVYYEDDGKSFDYEKNDFYKRSLFFDPVARQFVLGQVVGSFKSKFHHIKLIMHAFGPVKQVKVNGKAAESVSKFYKMIPSSNNIDPQAGAGIDNGAAAVYEVNFDMNDQRQIVDFELN